MKLWVGICALVVSNVVSSVASAKPSLMMYWHGAGWYYLGSEYDFSKHRVSKQGDLEWHFQQKKIYEGLQALVPRADEWGGFKLLRASFTTDTAQLVVENGGRVIELEAISDNWREAYGKVVSGDADCDENTCKLVLKVKPGDFYQFRVSAKGPEPVIHLH